MGGAFDATGSPLPVAGPTIICSPKHWRQTASAITGGRADVRKLLYMATLTARSWNPTIKEFAKRLTEAGKPFKVMMTACMRKLLSILNTMVRMNTKWNPKTNEVTP